MNALVDGASVVAITEFIKKVAARIGVTLSGEVIMIIGVLVGAGLAFYQNADVIQGGLIGAAAVGTHTVARTVSGK